MNYDNNDNNEKMTITKCQTSEKFIKQNTKLMI